MAKKNAKNLKFVGELIDKRCENCLFWEHNIDKSDVGFCKQWDFNVNKLFVCDSFVNGYVITNKSQDQNFIRDYELLTGNNPDDEMFAVETLPKLTKSDYENMFIVRYFVRQANNDKSEILEVSKEQLLNLGNFYKKINLKWKISGKLNDTINKDGHIVEKGVYNVNRDILKLKEKEMSGISKKLFNLMQFYKK